MLCSHIQQPPTVQLVCSPITASYESRSAEVRHGVERQECGVNSTHHVTAETHSRDQPFALTVDTAAVVRYMERSSGCTPDGIAIHTVLRMA